MWGPRGRAAHHRQEMRLRRGAINQAAQGNLGRAMVMNTCANQHHRAAVFGPRHARPLMRPAGNVAVGMAMGAAIASQQQQPSYTQVVVQNPAPVTASAPPVTSLGQPQQGAPPPPYPVHDAGAQPAPPGYSPYPPQPQPAGEPPIRYPQY